MRVAVAIHGSDISRVLRTYDALSLGRVTFPSVVFRSAGFGSMNPRSGFIVDAGKRDERDIIHMLESAKIDSADGAVVGLGLHDFPPGR